jgi:hypothetical protein
MPMRWDDLFDDLEAQLGQLEEAELAGEVADRTRIEVSKFRLVDRLRPAFGHRLELTVAGRFSIQGTVVGVGNSWLLLREERGTEVLVPLDAITSVAGLGNISAAPGSEGTIAARLTLGHALRGVARDRSTVAVGLRDEVVLTGTIDRVGADFFEMAEHALDTSRRAGNVAGVRTVPFTGVALIRRES